MADHGAAGEAQGDDAADGASSDASQAGELAQLVAEVRQADRHVAAAVGLAGRLAGSGVAEAEAGQPLELVLATACRLTGADRHVLVTAGEIVAHMPVLQGQFKDGWLSWAQVRAITQRAKRLSPARLAELDARLAATIDARGGLDHFAPDELVNAASDAVRELDDLDVVERGERDTIRESFVAIQRDVFGGARSYGEFDPQTAATILGALQAASPRPHAGQAHHRPDDGDGGGENGDDDGPRWSPPARSRQHAQGLWRIAAEWLAGQPTGTDGTSLTDPTTATGDAGTSAGDGASDAEGASDAGGTGEAGAGGGAGAARSMTGRRARPLLTVKVSLSQAQAAVAGTLDVAAGGQLPRLTAAAVETLACSGQVRAVVVDGARPLATTAAVTAARIPDATRRAVEARDRHCRWAGCDQPLAFTDLHHLTPQARGGTHHPDNLVALCRSCHQRAHTHHWSLQLDGATGALSGWRRGRRRWHTLPPGTPLAHSDGHHDGNGGDPPDGRDPPEDPDGRDPPDGERFVHGPFFDHHGHPLPF